MGRPLPPYPQLRNLWTAPNNDNDEDNHDDNNNDKDEDNHDDNNNANDKEYYDNNNNANDEDNHDNKNSRSASRPGTTIWFL